MKIGIGIGICYAGGGEGEASPFITAPVAELSGSDITITAVTNFDLSSGRFGAAISVNGWAATWYDGAGTTAGTQTLDVTLAAIGAVAGDLIGIDPGYSLTDPAVDKVYASESGLYITPSITTPSITGLSNPPTTDETATGVNGTALTRIGATRSVLWLGDGSSLGDTDNEHELTADEGLAISFRNTTSDGASATSAATADVVASAASPVVFDASAAETSANATSSTWAHTIGGGSNRLLVVKPANIHGGTLKTVSGVTFNGVACTQLAGAAVDTIDVDSVRSGLDCWYMKEADLPAAGTYDVVVSYTGTVRGMGGSESYSNVNQTSPFGTPVTAAVGGNDLTLVAAGIASDPNDIVSGQYIATGASAAIVDDQTNMWATNDVFGSGNCKGSRKAGDTSVNLSWTQGSGSNKSHCAFGVSVRHA